jgi:hypothetical protein
VNYEAMKPIDDKINEDDIGEQFSSYKSSIEVMKENMQKISE